MIRSILPLKNKSDFNKLIDLLESCLVNNDTFRFLSFTLIPFDKSEIIRFTKQHEEKGLEYIIYENKKRFQGILSFKRSKSEGFELFLLAVYPQNQNNGIGQKLIDECIHIASKDNYRCIDSFVFADNKKMLRLLINNEFRPVEIRYHARADNMDIIRLRKYI